MVDGQGHGGAPWDEGNRENLGKVGKPGKTRKFQLEEHRAGVWEFTLPSKNWEFFPGIEGIWNESLDPNPAPPFPPAGRNPRGNIRGIWDVVCPEIKNLGIPLFPQV